MAPTGGTGFSRYELLSQLGVGGMGEVGRACRRRGQSVPRGARSAWRGLSQERPPRAARGDHAAQGRLHLVAETQSSFALDAGGRPVRMRTIVRDVSERKALEAQLEALSLRDPLTGCYNRHYLARLRSDLDRPTARWSCLVLDLRGLKSINDTYGHEEGDRVLRGFAHFLGLHHRSDDVLLRLGGDEFAVLLPATDEPEALGISDRIRQQARGASPARFDIGVATRRPGEDLDAVLDRADRAMYAARGKQVVGSTPPEE